jgi:hypothetical protein
MIIHVKQGKNDSKEKFLDLINHLESLGYMTFDSGCYDKTNKLAEVILVTPNNSTIKCEDSESKLNDQLPPMCCKLKNNVEDELLNIGSLSTQWLIIPSVKNYNEFLFGNKNKFKLFFRRIKLWILRKKS